MCESETKIAKSLIDVITSMLSHVLSIVKFVKPAAISLSHIGMLLLSYCIAANSIAGANIILGSGYLSSSITDDSGSSISGDDGELSQARERIVAWSKFVVNAVISTSTAMPQADTTGDDGNVDGTNDDDVASAVPVSSGLQNGVDSSVAEAISRSCAAVRIGFAASCACMDTGLLDLSQETKSFERALNAWLAGRSKAGLWVVLSVVNYSAQKHKDAGESESETLGYYNDIGLVDMLIAVFFNRTREQKRGRTGSVFTLKGLQPSETLPLLTSWDDIKSHLLPNLPKSVMNTFGSRIASSLSKHFDKQPSDPSEKTEDTFPEFQPSLKPVEQQPIQPRKVCAIAFLSILFI
jgi:hypothetical protein